MSDPFKEGDLVEVTKGRSDSSEYLNGKIGRIIEVNSDWVRLDIEATAPNGGTGLWFSEIKKIENNLKEEKIDDKMEIIINKDAISIIDDEEDCIEITKEQLKEIYKKVFN